jgi:acyl carrier protein
MKINDKKIVDAIYQAIEEVNLMLPRDKLLAKSLDTKLVGENGGLDSLGTVNFIIAIEGILEDRFDLSIDFVKELESQTGSLSSVEKLAKFICTSLER